MKVKAPVPGRVLWTVETDHVVKSPSGRTSTTGDLTWTFTLDDVRAERLRQRVPRQGSAPREQGCVPAGPRVRRREHQHQADAVHADREARRAEGGALVDAALGEARRRQARRPDVRDGRGRRRGHPPADELPHARSARGAVRPSTASASRPTRRSAGRCCTSRRATSSKTGGGDDSDADGVADRRTSPAACSR